MGHNPPNVEKMLPGALMRNEYILERITGKELIRQWELEEDQDNLLVKFDSFILGMGPNGQKLDMNANFSLGASRTMGAARLFRGLVFNSFQIQPRSSPGDALRGAIIHNSRWGETKP